MAGQAPAPQVTTAGPGDASSRAEPRPAPTVLTPATSWGREDAPALATETERAAATVDRYRPPFDFVSDMLFVAALCPTAPLRAAFPATRFASFLGKTLLLAWFSRVREGCAWNAAGERFCEGGEDAVLYHELTIIIPLLARAFFVPGIYATSPRSTLLARHYYAMPKDTAVAEFAIANAGLRAGIENSHGGGPSGVRARILGSGRGLARVLSPLWPMRVWPVRFPAATEVRARIDAVPRMHPALIYSGRIALEAAWLPEPVPILPVGLYAPALRMHLPGRGPVSADVRSL